MDNSRTEILIGKEGVEKISKKSIAIIGVGGVGGYVAHILIRAGVENLTIIDYDIVSSSNCNRQVVASSSTIGLKKVEVLKNQLIEINPQAKINIYDEKICENNIKSLINRNIDFVIDCIDDVKNKVALIVYCKKNNINIISAMGAGNRVGIPKFYLTDISKTHDDGLAKVLRKKLREEKIEKLDVVTCDEKPIKTSGTIGSISYYPAMCGVTIASVVINKILKEDA